MNALPGLVLISIVIFQLLLIAFFLFTSPKGKRISNSLLGIVFLLLAIVLIDMLLSTQRYYTWYVKLALFDDAFILAFGPLIWLYARSVIYKDFRLAGQMLLHFVPYFLLTLFFLLVQGLTTTEDLEQLQENIHSFNIPDYVNLFFAFFYLHAGMYVYFAYREWLNYGKTIRERFSTIDEINLKWLGFTIRSIAIFGIIAVIHAFLPFTSFKGYFEISLLFFIGFLFYFINAVILKALRQPALFSGIEKKPPLRYKDSDLSAEMLDSFAQKIRALMETEQPYLDPDLTIDKLAEHLQMHPKKLSEIINRSFAKSFFQFINDYRIEEAQQLLLEPSDPKRTVLEVLYQSGFNSKSSFNTLFKKKTGLTPSQYRKANR